LHLQRILDYGLLPGATKIPTSNNTWAYNTGIGGFGMNSIQQMLNNLAINNIFDIHDPTLL